jgi:hypothetical protein
MTRSSFNISSGNCNEFVLVDGFFTSKFLPLVLRLLLHLTPYLGTGFIILEIAMTDSLTIGQLAKQAGVYIETIRYYQRRRLIPEPPKPPSGYR